MIGSLHSLFAGAFPDASAPAFIGLAAIVILIGFVFRYQREKMWNETIRQAIDKGQPIPPNVLACGGRWGDRRFGRGRMWRDVRAGLILIAVAIGLSVEHGGFPTHWHDGAAIMLVIGVALLINALLIALFYRNQDSNSDQSPKL